MSACTLHNKVLECRPIFKILDPNAIFVRKNSEKVYVQSWLTLSPDNDERVNGYPNVSLHLFNVSEERKYSESGVYEGVSGHQPEDFHTVEFQLNEAFHRSQVKSPKFAWMLMPCLITNANVCYGSLIYE